MLSAPVSHMKSMLRKQNPLNHGGGVYVSFKRPSVRERIIRMKTEQKAALTEEAACCNEWRGGTAGADSC